MPFIVSRAGKTHAVACLYYTYTVKDKISRSEFISLIISILVPGVITSLVDFDVAMFGAYAVVGSLFGIKSLGILIIVFLINHLINGIMGRIVVVSNRGPVELIRQYFGVRTSLFLFVVVLLLNLLSVVQIFSVIRIVGRLLDMNYLFVILFLLCYLAALFLLRLPKRFGYMILWILIFYTVIIAHVAVHGADIGRSLLAWKSYWTPLASRSSFFYIFALLGATVTAWSQLLISRYTYRRKINVDKLEYHVMENRTISLLSFLFACVFVIVMGYLFPHGSLVTVTHEGLAKLPVFIHSKLGEVFVALGLFFIALTTLVAIVLSTTHMFNELFGLEHVNEETKHFSTTNSIFLALLTIPAFLITLYVHINFFQTALLIGVIQSLFLIVEMRFLYIFSNDVSLMGRYKNDAIHNGALILIGAAVILTVMRILIQIAFHI